MCKYFIVCAVHVKKENDVTTVGCHFILEINLFCPYNLNTDISLTTAKLIIVVALSFSNVSISLLVQLGFEYVLFVCAGNCKSVG